MNYHIGLVATGFSLDPIIPMSTGAYQLIATMFQTLVKRNESNGAVEAELAQRWSVSADGLRYRFWIDGSHTHSGAQITAETAAYAISRHIQRDSPSTFSTLLRSLIAGADNAGPATLPVGLQYRKGQLDITLVAPYSPLLKLLAHPALAIGYCDHNGEFTGSGPLRPANTVASDDWMLLPNDRYVGDRILPDRMQIKRYATPAALAAACHAGKISIMVNDRNVPASLPRGWATTALREQWIAMLVLNPARGAMANLDFRRDLGLAVQAIAATLFDSAAGPKFQHRFLPAGLLPTACERPAGGPLSLTQFASQWNTALASAPLRIIYTPRRGALTKLLDALIAQMRAHDIPLEILATDNAPQVYDMVAKGQFDLVPRGWQEDFDDPDGYLDALIKQAPGLACQRTYSHFFQRIAAARHLDSAELRLQSYGEALTELEQQWLFIPFCVDPTQMLHHQHIQLSRHPYFPFDLASRPPSLQVPELPDR